MGLCTGCGTCVGICPNNAVKLNIVHGTYLPQVEDANCTNCGYCIKSCPGHQVDFTELNHRIFGNQCDASLLGNYLECYIGHSNDEYTRYNSSSGGMISELLIFALEEGIINGALVVRMKNDRPLEPEPFIARSKEQILSASKSKYCPVPANIALKHIIRQNGKFAVVGLPCHIHGIRKAETLDRRLREKIVLHLGLFCSHTVSFIGTEVLLHKFGINEQLVEKIDYRGNGWPGSLSITLINKQVFKPKERDFRKAYWNPLFGSFFFTPFRCMSCVDMTNELADLSFGDAWIKKILEMDRVGMSIVISRSEAGEKLLKEAKRKGKITLKKISDKHVLRSQLIPLSFKKVDIKSRLSILKSLGNIIPKYRGVKYYPNKYSFMISFLQILDAYVSNRKIGLFILKNTPFKVLRVWSAFLYFLELTSFKKLIEATNGE